MGRIDKLKFIVMGQIWKDVIKRCALCETHTFVLLFQLLFLVIVQGRSQVFCLYRITLGAIFCNYSAPIQGRPKK